jgi:hypothetical protein
LNDSPDQKADLLQPLENILTTIAAGCSTGAADTKKDTPAVLVALRLSGSPMAAADDQYRAGWQDRLRYARRGEARRQVVTQRWCRAAAERDR